MPDLKLAASPVFDLEHALWFLDTAFGDVTSGRLSLCCLPQQGPWRYASFPLLPLGAQWAAEQDKSEPQGIYFRTTFLPAETLKGRGKANDAHALAFCRLTWTTRTLPTNPTPCPRTRTRPWS
jgi:hypothetical protein